MTSPCPIPEASHRAPLGSAPANDDAAPQVLLRAGNVVPFAAAKSGRAAAPPAVQADRADAAADRPPGEPRQRLPWAASLACAIALHAGLAAALLGLWPVQPDELAGAPLILVELAPVPVAPAAMPSAAPPGPERPQAAASASERTPAAEPEKAPEPQKPPEHTASMPETPKAAPAAAEALPEPAKAEQTIAVLPPSKPAEQSQRHERPQTRAQTASAPSAVPHRAQRAAAPAPAASTSDPAAMANWKSQLLARLERSKRYPADAQARGEHGVAQLAFSIDRAGRVHGARIARSSGSRALDRATLELVERAQPLPPPPTEMRANRIAIVVPIRYSIR